MPPMSTSLPFYRSGLVMLAGILSLSLCRPALAGPPADPPAEARRLLEKGTMHHRKGQMAEAVGLLSSALERTPPDQPEAFRIRRLLADAHEQRGYFRTAFDTLRAGLPLPASLGPAASAAYLSELGDLHLSMGDIRESLSTLKRARSLAITSGDAGVLAAVLNNQGNALALGGKRDAALAVYEEGKARLQGVPGERAARTRVHLLLNLARHHLADPDPTPARPALVSAMADLQSLEGDHGTGTALISAGILFREIGRRSGSAAPDDISLAFSAFQRALEIGRAIDHPGISAAAAGRLGKMYADAGRLPAAMALTREAIFLAGEGRFPEERYRWQWQLGRLHDAQGNPEAAMAFLSRAVETLTPIRGELMKDRRRRGEIFDEEIRPVYLDLARLLVTAAEGLPRGADREAKLEAAREAMETLKSAELEDFFQDPCVTARTRQGQRLDRTPDGAAILYPIVFADRISLLLTLPDGMRLATTPVDANRLDRAVRRFRGLLQSPGTGRRYRFYARRLYDWLIRPIAGDLREAGIRTLVVAPDGVLRLIPFAALHDGERFLSQHFGMATVPGLTLTAAGEGGAVDARPLLAGLSEARQGFRPLPAVPGELYAIQSLLGGKVLLDTDYTMENLKTAFSRTDYSLIHLATHGEFGGSSEETFLLTSEGRLTMDRLERFIDLGRFRDTPVELLTLSACQTALGDVRSALGLGGVAVKAGARSALATLWSVDDEATSLTVRTFYEAFGRPATDKAGALQRAQARLIQDETFAHPAYWAPFLLIGNWR